MWQAGGFFIPTGSCKPLRQPVDTVQELRHLIRVFRERRDHGRDQDRDRHRRAAYIFVIEGVRHLEGELPSMRVRVTRRSCWPRFAFGHHEYPLLLTIPHNPA